MEGMVVSGSMEIQAGYMRMHGIHGGMKSWAVELSIYTWAMAIPDHHCAQQRLWDCQISIKEEIFHEIEAQLERDKCRGYKHLLWECQEYWMLAIQAAWWAKQLRGQVT